MLALADALRRRGWHLASAESCTGGLIAAACTAVAGSSDWFERGFVTYSNAAKTEHAGRGPGADRRARRGQRGGGAGDGRGRAASAPVQLAVAVTGIAGPGGAAPGKPVGTVWLALAWRGERPAQARAERLQLDGDRAAVREQTVRQALRRLREAAA